MKVNEFKTSSLPTFATFNTIGDSYTLTLTEEVVYVDDPLNPGSDMLKIVGTDESGNAFQINGRTQLPDAVQQAVKDAGVEEITVGDVLTVKFVSTRGRMKVYEAKLDPAS